MNSSPSRKNSDVINKLNQKKFTDDTFNDLEEWNRCMSSSIAQEAVNYFFSFYNPLYWLPTSIVLLWPFSDEIKLLVSKDKRRDINDSMLTIRAIELTLTFLQQLYATLLSIINVIELALKHKLILPPLMNKLFLGYSHAKMTFSALLEHGSKMAGFAIFAQIVFMLNMLLSNIQYQMQLWQAFDGSIYQLGTGHLIAWGIVNTISFSAWLADVAGAIFSFLKTGSAFANTLANLVPAITLSFYLLNTFVDIVQTYVMISRLWKVNSCSLSDNNSAKDEMIDTISSLICASIERCLGNLLVVGAVIASMLLFAANPLVGALVIGISLIIANLLHRDAANLTLRKTREKSVATKIGMVGFFSRRLHKNMERETNSEKSSNRDGQRQNQSQYYDSSENSFSSKKTEEHSMTLQGT